MRLLLIGPPGSGKGTQAHLLSERRNLTHIGTGNLLREAIRQNTEAGQKAHSFVDAGKMVPDEVVNQLVAEYFRAGDQPLDFVMDGYPRNRDQAIEFDRLTHALDLSLDAVVELQVDEDVLIKRLSGRRICPKCNAVFHLMDHPPKVSGICDHCGTELNHRQDDNEATVRHRLEVFKENTEGLLQYYGEQDLLKQINAGQNIEVVYQEIVNLLQRK